MRSSHSVLVPKTGRTGQPSSLGRNTACGTEPKESLAGLAFLPIVATAGYYWLPPDTQAQSAYQFAPQIISYVCLGVWLCYNRNPIQKLGLSSSNLWKGLRWGTLTGMLLGTLNTLLILLVAPALGWDIEFLRHTPHAQIPLPLMVPWFILFIAAAVEINFRGFLLGRLRGIFVDALPSSRLLHSLALALALGSSALTFAFDPFLVTTFRHLHWIAMWDGLIWGWIWLRTGNLYTVILAHFTEVTVEYVVIRSAFL